MLESQRIQLTRHAGDNRKHLLQIQVNRKNKLTIEWLKNDEYVIAELNLRRRAFDSSQNKT